MTACFDCLRRTWLLEQMGSHLDFRRGRIVEILELEEAALIELTSGALRVRLERDYARFDRSMTDERAAAAETAGLSMLCRCSDDYPARLRAVRSAPAVLHVAGGRERFLELCAADPVAVVGSRRATAYGLEISRSLGRGISASGLTVVSGMATGVDGAAHEGALAGGGRTLAVIPGCASEPYPRGQRSLHRRILVQASAVSETGPGAVVRRWMLPARNRIIAALSELTVLVQAAERSGAELTVKAAQRYGRAIGAVPGSVLLEQSTVANALLAGGACVIRDAQDVLDAVFGAGLRSASSVPFADIGDGLDGPERAVLEAIVRGADTAAALARAGYGGQLGLTVLARLELNGVVRRAAGGRYEVCR